MRRLDAITRDEALALVEAGEGTITQYGGTHRALETEREALDAFNAAGRGHAPDNIVALFFEPGRNFYGRFLTLMAVERPIEAKAHPCPCGPVCEAF